MMKLEEYYYPVKNETYESCIFNLEAKIRSETIEESLTYQRVKDPLL